MKHRFCSGPWLSRTCLCPLIGLSVLFGGSLRVTAESIQAGDVTAALGPDFFVDTAGTGGSDSIGETISWEIDLGQIRQGADGSDLMLTGLGWASPGNGVTATQIRATITHLGADGLSGGGDDLLIGERSAPLGYTGAGEYFWHFDHPLNVRLDTEQARFRITLDTEETGEIRLKNDSEDLPKLSISGSAVAMDPVNLALYRPVNADSAESFAPYATDGIVGSDFKWIAQTGATLPQSLEIEFPGPVEIGSYHLFHGVNEQNKCLAFHLEHLGPNGWESVPGSAVTDNTTSENSVVFPPVQVERLRLIITANEGDGRPRIREWAVFPPATGNPHPLGTEVTLNMAENGFAEASSTVAEHFAINAVDSFSDTYWLSADPGPHTLEVRLRDEIDIRSVHLHSGPLSETEPPSDFTIEYLPEGSSVWAVAPGGYVSGNTETARIITFDSAVRAEAVRLLIHDPGPVAVRELQVYPENGLGGYPENTNISQGAPPLRDWDRYGDAFYRILAADGRALRTGSGAAALEPVNDLDPRQIFQIVLNADGLTHRIFNRETRETLTVTDASLAPGALVENAPHSAFPSHQWHVRPAPRGTVYLQNAFSGLFATASPEGDGIVQQPFDGSMPQRWTLDLQKKYPKKGSAGFPEYAASMNSSWAYSWTNNDLPALDSDQVDFMPMQWGRFNLDPDRFNSVTQLPTTLRYPDWFNRGYPLVHLGFNEPDKENQANMDVAEAIHIWPQLMASGLPLLSPVTAQVNGPWMVEFMAEADGRGYRNDFIGMHTYLGPFPELIMEDLNDLSAAYDGRPVWLTEFGFSDFSDTQSWTENELYRALLELLWSLEAAPNCARYALFGFVEDAEFPQPGDPTGRMRRSNWLNADGSFTSIGELYMGWDGELAPSPDEPYILYNRSFDQRIANPGDGSVGRANVRVADDSVRVAFESIGNGFYYITSLLDGRRLRQSGPETVEWAAATTTGPEAEWSWSNVERGWQLISNRNSGRNLRYTDAEGVHIGPDNGAFYHWFFIPTVHLNEAIPPAPPTELSTSSMDRRVDLNWSHSFSADLAYYRVKRATDPDGPYTTLEAPLYTSQYSDESAENGQAYYYQVEAVDQSGNAATSTTASATPAAPLPTSYDNWTATAFADAPDAMSTEPGSDPDGDGLSNFFEYAFLLDPTQFDAARVDTAVDPTDGFQISFTLNPHATDLQWTLLGGSDLSDRATWPEVPFSVISEIVEGQAKVFTITPDAPPETSMFFTIELESTSDN